MLKFVSLAAAAGALAFSTFAWGDPSSSDGSYVSYENLVNELKASADEPTPTLAPRLRDDFDWEDVAIHGGVALTTSLTSVAIPGASGGGLLKGVAVGLGMNLFSRKLRAEGVFGDYSEANLSNGIRAELKEFELRFVYLPSLDNANVLRFGTGVAARYMTLSMDSHNYDSSAPTSLFLFGLEHRITDSIALGPDLSFRSPLTSDSLEKSAWDASFRLNATF